MSGDVRSLEEVIAAASRQWQRMLDNGEYEGHTVNEVTAAAVRAWCRERGVNLDDLEKHGDGGE